MQSLDIKYYISTEFTKEGYSPVGEVMFYFFLLTNYAKFVNY